MKHLADFVQVLPLSDYSLFDGNALESKSGASADQFNATNELVFEITQGNGNGNIFYTEQVRVVVPKLTDDQRKKYYSGRALIVLLFTDTGDPVLWGNMDQKVRITIIPNLDYDVLDLVRKTTKPLF